MRIATWNVNGIRARETQFRKWMEHERPDIVCLQEIKASPLQVPPALSELEGYWCYWHGLGGYSGVALHVSKELSPELPSFAHPPFDMETRIVTATIRNLLVASVYVPNGGKDFAAKMKFLEALEEFVQEKHQAGLQLVLCGDLNVARTDQDVHPKERKPKAIGQLPEERELMEKVLAKGLADVGRALDPTNEALFTWWPPWRNMRQRNIGWRIDYILASQSLMQGARHCIVQAEVGTSDHAPVVATFE